MMIAGGGRRPPAGAVAGFDHGGDRTDVEDALFAFARCMRDEGVDIADPTSQPAVGRPGFFGDFHRFQDDPAFEAC